MNRKISFSILLLTLSISGAIKAESEASEVSPDPTGQFGEVFQFESIENQPIPKAWKDAAKKERKQMAERGYADASEETIIDVDRIVVEVNERRQKDKKLAAQETNPEFEVKSSRIRGDIASGVKTVLSGPSGTVVDGTWTGSNRVLDIPQLGLVYVEEMDYILGGGNGGMVKEFINTEVNGYPAVFTVKKSDSGKWSTELTWVTENKTFYLAVTKRIIKDKRSYKKFMELARSFD